MAIIRDYNVVVVLMNDVPEYINVTVKSDSRDKKIFAPLPTVEEANDAVGYTNVPLYLINAFRSTPYLIASPFIDKRVQQMGSAFGYCANLYYPPSLPRATSLMHTFYNAGIFISPTIPKEATDCESFCLGATNLRVPASIPANVTWIREIYKDCSNLSGEFIIRPTSMGTYRYGLALENTVKPITIYGDQALCEAVAATANNGNASWQPWYDPVPAVTDRGQGSYTTAADMTRIVRNGCLAVDSYAPGRMVYNQGDIVRQDEWEALVEAAQTIDPTVTMSTHYTNLNKIEKAFDDAL